MALPAKNNITSPKNRCRICLEATNGKIELNQMIVYEETGILLRELLEFCMNEQVHENGQADGLCLGCMEKGMVCYEFKKRFEVSQGILLKEIEENNSFEVKIEEDFEEGSFVVEAENTVINDETTLQKESQDVSENLNKCDVCGKNYNSRSGMLRHKRRLHILKNPDPQLPTTETDKPTTAETDTPPSRTEIDEPTPTFPGDKATSTPPVDKPTNSLQQKVVENKCELCEKTFKLRSSLVRHKRTHTETAKSCNRCTYVSESSAALVEHMRHVHQQIVSIRKQIPCPTCGKIFFKKRNLCLHMLIHAGIKKHTCEFCGLSFTLAGNLATHRRIHTGEKPYSCTECGRSFSQHASWKSHQVVHSKRRDHVCQKCGAAFARSGDLSKHVKRHSTERPFKCTICTKAFTSSWGKKEHMLTHTGVRNHACEFCGKRFNRSSSLSVHRKIHTGETPHTCVVCGKGFIQAHCLRTHMNTHLTKKN